MTCTCGGGGGYVAVIDSEMENRGDDFKFTHGLKVNRLVKLTINMQYAFL